MEFEVVLGGAEAFLHPFEHVLAVSIFCGFLYSFVELLLAFGAGGIFSFAEFVPFVFIVPDDRYAGDDVVLVFSIRCIGEWCDGGPNGKVGVYTVVVRPYEVFAVKGIDLCMEDLSIVVHELVETDVI